MKFDKKNRKFGSFYNKSASSTARETIAIYSGGDAFPTGTLTDIFDFTCRQHAFCSAIDDGNSVVTYEQLQKYAIANARRILDLGIQPGSRIGVCLPSGEAKLYLAIVAILYAGCAYVPVDFDESAERAAMIFAEADVSAVIGIEGIRISSGSSETFILDEESLPSGFKTAGNDVLPTVDPHDDAWIIFTSGSTGKPKAVAVTHKSAAALVDAEAKTFLQSRPLSPGDRVMAGLSVSFDASVEEMWLAWRNGACLVPFKRGIVRSVIDLGKEIKKRNITAISTVPSIAAFFEEEDLSTVRLLILGGEKCSANLAERLLQFSFPSKVTKAVGSAGAGREIWNTYGPTETTVIATAQRLIHGEPIRIGLPIPGYRLAVVDDNLAPVPMGAEGQLVISGVGTARYLDSEKDSSSFVELSCFPDARTYLTGDIVKAEPEGLICLGRMDEQVKIAGKRIELGEVEECCRQLPGVRDAAAVLHGSDSESPVLAAYLVTDFETDNSSLTAALTKMLPTGCVPYLVRVAELPRKISGKVDKSVLPWPPDNTQAKGNTYQFGTDYSDCEKNLDGIDIEVTAKKKLFPARDSLSITKKNTFLGKLLSSFRLQKLNNLSTDATRSKSVISNTESVVSITDHKDEDIKEFVMKSWASVIGRRPLDNEDFFVSGGNSLSAARLVALLRKRFPTLPIAELYRNRRPQELVSLLEKIDQVGNRTEITYTPRKLFALGQISVILFSYTVVAMEWLLTLLILSSLLIKSSWAPHINLLLCVLVWLALISPPARTVLAVIFARLFTGSIVPGKYKRGGLVHFKLWTAEFLVARFAPVSMLGTPLINIYAKAIGCRVGDGVVLQSMPPVTGLAQFAFGVTVETEVDLSGWRLGVSEVEVGSISIGEFSRLATRSVLAPGVTIAENAEVMPGTYVQENICKPGIWAGSPARQLAGEKSNLPIAMSAFSRLWKFAFSLTPGLLTSVGLVAAVIPLIFLSLFSGIANTADGFAALRLELLWAPILALSWIAAYIFTLVTLLRSLSFRLKGGTYPLYSFIGWRIWLVESLVGAAPRALFPLYASLVTPFLFRMFGVKVGKNAEISTLWCNPAFCNLDNKTFLADDTKVGCSEYGRGWIAISNTHLKEGTFMGNSALIQHGSDIGKDVLIGVMTLAPKAAQSGSSWLGNQALELPLSRMQSDETRTYQPSKKLFAYRLSVEIWRLIVPIFSLVILEGVGAALLDCYRYFPVYLTVILSGAILLAGAGVAVLLSIVAKWLIVGRLKPGEHLLWSSFVWRNELVDVFIEDLAAPWLLQAALGTPLLNCYMRLLGAKIGKGVTCDTYWLPEADLVEIGDGTVVNWGSVLQTHLFHDRVLRLDRVEIGNYCELGRHCITLPGSRIDHYCSIGDSSLLGRGEELPKGTTWQGNLLQPNYIEIEKNQIDELQLKTN